MTHQSVSPDRGQPTRSAAYEQSPAAVRKWLDEQCPVIAACAEVEGAEIHWGDETGLRSDDVRGRSFAPQGQTPVVRVNDKRHGLSIISTVTNREQIRWKIFDRALNAGMLIDFLERLVRSAGARSVWSWKTCGCTTASRSRPGWPSTSARSRSSTFPATAPSPTRTSRPPGGQSKAATIAQSCRVPGRSSPNRSVWRETSLPLDSTKRNVHVC